LPGVSLTIRFVGLGQSLVDQTMHDHCPLDKDIILQSQFESGRVDFTFSLPDDTPENRRRLDALKEQLLRHLGDYVYATDETTLEQHVLQRLASRRETLAVAEAGSGGILTSALAGTEASARVLAGSVIASDDSRLARLVDADQRKWETADSRDTRVGLLARSVASHLQSDWGLAVGPLERDSNGSESLNVAIHGPGDETISHKVSMRDGSRASRVYLTTRLLDLLRKRLP
jgi:nicotinamide-nucleotide amidase